MKRALLLSVVLSLAFSAGAAPFGKLFPVTNTRYRSAVGEPRLVTNDRDFFLFWGAEQKIRAARVDDGEARVSHVVLDSNDQFDVAWTGEHHVIVSVRRFFFPFRTTVVGRVLDSEAHPASAEFTIANPGGERPRIAAGEHSVAVIYGVPGETRLVVLSRNGRTVVAPSRVIAPLGHTYAVTRNGDGFLAIISMNDGIRAVALDRHGQTIAENTFAAEPAPREVSVASNGTTAMLAWSAYHGAAAITVDQNAGFGAPLDLSGERGGNSRPTVAWNGTGWTVSYGHASNVQTVVVLQLDWRGRTILAREETADKAFSPTIAALDGRVLAAWRMTGENRSPIVAELPLASHRRRETPWVPSQQTLLATASSADATLTVWSENIDEGISIHAGLRNLQGQWSERQLTTMPYAVFGAVAASDGNGFAVALSGSGSSTSIFRLDALGRTLGATSLPIHPVRVMAWNGTNYGMISQYGSGVLVSPSGVVSAVVATTAADFDPVALASDGNGFFLAGHLMKCEGDILCIPQPYEIRGARLGPDLKRLDQEDFRVPRQDGPTVVGAAWDGSRYLLIGNDPASSSFLSYIPSSPPYVLETKRLGNLLETEAMTLLHDGTIAIAARLYDMTNRVSFFDGEGVLLHDSYIEGSLTDAPRLEPLAGGGVALLASSVQNAAPHDGTSRIVTAIARPSGVLPPGPPHVGVRVQNGMMRVDWTAPAGTVNGYRLEYRVDDDEWVEWEQWFGPGEQSKSIRKPSFGTQFAFRVRAFNDGGASEYSATALTKPSRRRAVR